MRPATTVRRVITDDAAWAADRLADGGTVAQAFANFYVITTRRTSRSCAGSTG